MMAVSIWTSCPTKSFHNTEISHKTLSGHFRISMALNLWNWCPVSKTDWNILFATIPGAEWPQNLFVNSTPTSIKWQAKRILGIPARMPGFSDHPCNWCLPWILHCCGCSIWFQINLLVIIKDSSATQKRWQMIARGYLRIWPNPKKYNSALWHCVPAASSALSSVYRFF